MYEDPNVDVWFNQTTLHPLGIIAILLLGVATIVVPRRYALVPALVVACFVAPAQRVVLATLDFNFLRIMVFFGWARVLLRGELASFREKLAGGVYAQMCVRVFLFIETESSIKDHNSL